MEFKHSNGKDGPNLKDRRKAMIEQTHFFKLTHTQKTRLQAAKGSPLRRLHSSIYWGNMQFSLRVKLDNY